MKDKYIALTIALCLVFIGVLLRVLPHPANFAPVAAISIFGAAILPRRIALWVPLGAMMFSDAIIGLHPLIPVTWGCYLLIALASSRWLRQATLAKGASLTVAASVFFFAVTNFAVWASSGMYALNWHGFVECYAMALPFFRNTLLSDLIYTGLLFGVYALASRSSRLTRKTSISTHTA